MKKIIMSLSAVVAVMSYSTGAFAQSSASATATATGTIIVPISITKLTDLNFGIAVSGPSTGTVIMAPSGSRSRTGGATFIPTTGTVTAATFTVNGEGTYTYDVTVPSSAVTLTSGSNTMTATTFTSNPGATAGALTAGTQALGVGATLNVGASQASGVYVSGNFTVMVAYN